MRSLQEQNPGVATDSIELEVERIERAEGVMKKSLLLVAACLIAGTSIAQTSDEQRPRTVYELRRERIWAREKRIQETRPQRRDSPLREENIRDEEVREIQAAARGIVPKAIVNIAGVVTGCPCEEGSTCSDQVWILASNADRTFGLQLSKIGNAWKVGLIQRWWLEREALLARQDSFRSYSEFYYALEALNEQFPMCAAALTKPKDASVEGRSL